MAYFSNGTEGMMYEERYCNRCIHGPDCVVWAVHFDYNYDQNKDEKIKAILSALIPRDGLWNAECTMFIERQE